MSRGSRQAAPAGLNGSSFLLGAALGNVMVTVMIATFSATTWQQRLVDAGMTPEAAASAYSDAQRAIFLETAHPFIDPTLLDVVQQIPGWAAVFTDGFTGAMVVLAAVTAVGTLVAFLGLRGSGDAQAPAA